MAIGGIVRANIRHFEKTARLLEPNAQQRALLAEETGRYCQHFLDQLGQRPAYDPNPGNPDALLNMPISDEPRALDEPEAIQTLFLPFFRV